MSNRYQDITARAMSDTNPFPVFITIQNAWMLHSSLILAQKHPHLSDAMKSYLRDINRKFQQAIVARYPSTQPLFKYNLSQQQFIEGAYEAMSDLTPLYVELTFAKAWVLVSAIQLVTHHSGVPIRMARQIKDIALQFQHSIEDRYPAATQLINRGWDPAYDVDAD